MKSKATNTTEFYFEKIYILKFKYRINGFKINFLYHQ